MSTDSPLPDLPQDDALAALMASPGFQEQMAELTRQAMGSLQGLIEAMRAAEAQLAANPPKLSPAVPLPETVIEIPYGLAVEPGFIPWSAPVVGDGAGTKDVTGGGDARLGGQFFGPAVMPAVEELTVDMLTVLPKAAAGIEVVAVTQPAAAGGGDTTPVFVFMPDHRAGGEGGVG